MKKDFEVTILGNTSSIPVHGRNHTAQVLRHGQSLFLIDCGEGTQLQLRRYQVKASKINHIFISHLHGDHYLGLIGLLSSYGLTKRSSPIFLYGPRGLDEIITSHLKWSNTRLSYPLHFVETQDDQLNLLIELPNLMIYSFPLKHRIPTTGFLFREKPLPRNLIKEKLLKEKLPLEAIQSLRKGMDHIGADGSFYAVRDFCLPKEPERTYAYCSDTIYLPEIAEYIRGADLLYHESTFMENDKERAKMTFHTTAMEAGEIAKLAKVKTLMLGHFSSRYPILDGLLAEAKTVFKDSMLSEEGKTYRL